MPIRVDEPSLDDAQLLILDHSIAALTDEEGVARFDRLPLGFELPMRVVYPQPGSAGLRFESDSLEMMGGRFLLHVGGKAPRRHEIRILADKRG